MPLVGFVRQGAFFASGCKFFLQCLQKGLGGFGENLVFLPDDGRLCPDRRFQGPGAEGTSLRVDQLIKGEGVAHAFLDHQGGVVDQFVSTQSAAVTGKTIYIHVGGNVWFKAFNLGCHGDGSQKTPHVPVSVSGGDYDSFYLTGYYNPNAAVYDDNAECYISGGRFGEVAGGGQEQIGNKNGGKGNIHWQIYDADITEFYGGGINDAKPAQGNITTDIFNSHVDKFCGGPKFGNMQTGKKVVTNADGCVFGKYFGAGNGGNSYSKKKYFDNTTFNWTTLNNYYINDKGKYYDGQTTDAVQSKYGKKGPGVATDFGYEFFVWTSGTAGVRFYVHFASFSLAQCNDVESNLTGCTINESFYGGGNLGSVIGTAKSVLDGCTVHGNVFGGGYSAAIPKIPVRNSGFTTNPNFNSHSGMFEPGVPSGTTDYEWKQVANYPNNATIGTVKEDDKNYVVTTTNLGALGQVANTDLTVKGNTVVEGKIFEYDTNGDVVKNETTGEYSVKEQTGGVFGGGDESAVNENTKVRIQKEDEGDQTPTVNNVFGGGNTADVVGDAVVMMSHGTVSHDVFGGGKGATTVVGGDVNVHIGKTYKEDGTTVDLSGTPTIMGSVYGGSAFGAVNATKDNGSTLTATANKTTAVNI